MCGRGFDGHNIVSCTLANLPGPGDSGPAPQNLTVALRFLSVTGFSLMLQRALWTLRAPQVARGPGGLGRPSGRFHRLDRQPASERLSAGSPSHVGAIAPPLAWTSDASDAAGLPRPSDARAAVPPAIIRLASRVRAAGLRRFLRWRWSEGRASLSEPATVAGSVRRGVTAQCRRLKLGAGRRPPVAPTRSAGSWDLRQHPSVTGRSERPPTRTRSDAPICTSRVRVFSVRSLPLPN